MVFRAISSPLVTYRECAQLSGSALAPNGKDLGHLAGNTQSSGSGLQVCHGLRVHEGLVEEKRVNAGRDNGNKSGSSSGTTGECQDENTNCDILDGDESRLSVCAEGELVAHAVRQRDEQTGGFKGVGHEGNTGGGARADQLQDLRDLDHSASADNCQAERLGNRQGCARRVLGETQIEKQRVVARRADQRLDGIVNRFGDRVDDGVEVRLEGIHDGLLKGVHGGWLKGEGKCC